MGTLWSWSPPARLLDQETESELVSKFAKKAAPVTSTARRSAARTTSIIDSTRERNVGIVLQFLRLPIQSIESAIAAMDNQVLCDESVSGLLGIYPTLEEQQQVLACSEAQLSSLCLKFFLMCARNKGFESRLKCWLAMYRFDSTRLQLETSVSQVAKACDCIVAFTPLHLLLHFLLAAGNKLNEGVPALRNASGFRIADVVKAKALTDTSYDPSLSTRHGSLQHSLLFWAVSKRNLGSLAVARRCVDDACKVDVAVLKSEMNELRSLLTSCERYAVESREDRIAQFVLSAKTLFDQLDCQFQTMTTSVTALLQFFGENDSDVGDVLALIGELLDDIERCQSLIQ